MGKGIAREVRDGGGLRVGIVRTRWNTEIIDQLVQRCIEGLRDCGVDERQIFVREVPGSFELPFGAKQMVQRDEVDVVVVIGALIKGETMHFEYIADAVSQGIMRVNIDSDTPVIFGLLTCLNEEQAARRASIDGLDHGYEWGLSAVEMALFAKKD